MVFSLLRIRLAHVFDVLLRWWLLGICAGLWWWWGGVQGDWVAVGLLELPPQACLLDGGPDAHVLLWEPPWFLPCAPHPAWGRVTSRALAAPAHLDRCRLTSGEDTGV